MPHDKKNPNKNTDCGLRGTELFEAVIKQIKENEEHWDQGEWAIAKVPSDQDTTFDADQYGYVTQLPESCGTAYCLAGWAAHMTGAEILWEPQYTYLDYEMNEKKLRSFKADSVRDAYGDIESIENYAAQVLGFGGDDLSIFNEEMNIEDFENLLAEKQENEV